MNPQDEIRTLMKTFQDGYTHRDLSKVDTFMELFTVDAEVIGTNGLRPGVDEWYVGRSAARVLVEDDWAEWGDLRVNIEAASITTRGDVGWIAAPATVIKTIGVENYDSYLEFVKNYLATSTQSAEHKLHFILRGGTNTIYELNRGEHFVWALRLTAVVIREKEEWKFAQMNFSFPTINFPDVRIIENPV